MNLVRTCTTSLYLGDVNMTIRDGGILSVVKK